MEIGLFRNRRIVKAVQLNKENFAEWIDLDPVCGVSYIYGEKEPYIQLSSYTIQDGIKDRNGFSVIGYFGDYLCLDDKGDWRVLEKDEYDKLDDNKSVFSPINRQTERQLVVLYCINKMKEDFEKMSYEEKLAFADKYPDFVKIDR